MDLIIRLLNSIPGVNHLPPALITLLAILIPAVVVLGFIAAFALFAIWLERKVSAHIQDRLGPMRTGGWHGWAQTIADALKLLLKEDLAPLAADRRLFLMAPYIVFMASVAAFVVIPWTRDFIVADLSIGIFYVVAISSLTVIGIIMAGWASNNKWSLLGGMRSAAQIVSYEIPGSLAVLAAVMTAGSMSLKDMAELQSGGIGNWIVFRAFPFNFIAFWIYFIATLAEVNRTPFDIPEAESELVAGFHTEYSGMRFAIFFLGEYANMFLVGALGATLFLGGWNSPFGDFLNSPGWQVVWILLKSVGLVFVHMWLRWTLPRLRVDQLMYVSWKVLTPFAFACVVGVGVWMLA